MGELHHLRILRLEVERSVLAPGGELSVSVNVRNTGARAGKLAFVGTGSRWVTEPACFA
jgi:hypothetical protein